MKILVVTTWFPGAHDPATGAFVAKDVLALAAENDVRVLHLVAPRLHDGGPERTEHGGVPVRRLVIHPGRPAHLARAHAAVAAESGWADVVHTMAFSTLLPFLGRARPDRPWLHTEHWQGVTSRRHLALPLRLAMPVLERLLLRPDVVTAVSEYATAPIRALRGSRPTAVVPCIAATPAVPPARRDRGRDGDHDATLRLVAVGFLNPLKDPGVAVRTLAELAARGVDVHLTWVGDGPLRAETEALASELGVRERLVITGAVAPADVGAHLAEADVFFLPTRRETFGVAIAEAIAHGRPVVVGATGAQREYVAPRVGALVDVQDPAAYADAILRVDEATRDLAAADVAASIGGAFAAERVVAGYERAYREAVAGPSRPGRS